MSILRKARASETFNTVNAAVVTATAAEIETLDAEALEADTLAAGGLTTAGLTLTPYQAEVTIINGATDGKEAAIAMPANFLPLCVGVRVTVASTNAVNLTDIGDDGDTDSYVDTIAVAVNSTGYKGLFSCNGLRGFPGGTANTGALGTADEVMATLSADPGAAGCTLLLTFWGIVGA